MKKRGSRKSRIRSRPLPQPTRPELRTFLGLSRPTLTRMEACAPIAPTLLPRSTQAYTQARHLLLSPESARTVDQEVVVSYHDANAKMQVKHDPNQPEEGIFKMSFVIPAEWGEVTERSSFTSPWGRPAEGLLFNRHGWIKRLTMPIQGYD